MWADQLADLWRLTAVLTIHVPTAYAGTRTALVVRNVDAIWSPYWAITVVASSGKNALAFLQSSRSISPPDGGSRPG